MGAHKIGVGIGVILLKDNKILLGRRNDDPDKAGSKLRGAGTWTMPGGGLYFQESFEQGAAREVNEETRIVLNSANVICVNNDMTDAAHFVTVGLISEDFSGEPQVLEPEEITEWRWFGFDDLPTPMYFPSKKILNNYQKQAFYIQKNDY